MLPCTLSIVSFEHLSHLNTKHCLLCILHCFHLSIPNRTATRQQQHGSPHQIRGRFRVGVAPCVSVINWSDRDCTVGAKCTSMVRCTGGSHSKGKMDPFACECIGWVARDDAVWDRVMGPSTGPNDRAWMATQSDIRSTHTHTHAQQKAQQKRQTDSHLFFFVSL